jgi:hypothetical protein
MASEGHAGSGAKNALGGLVGAIAALLGILLGNTMANLTSAEHPPAHHEAGESESH